MTYEEAKRGAAARLASAGVEYANTEARELVARSCGLSPREADRLRFDEFPRGCEAALDALIARRMEGEPLQYIIGEWEFMGLPFHVDARALIPRQDTETLVEEAARIIAAGGHKSCLDMCTGTGCIGISLAKLTHVRATLADISPDALALALENAALNRVEVETVETNLFDGIMGEYDIIVSNPPYISAPDMEMLSREVKKEPALALYGGLDGLDMYRRIARGFGAHLNMGGALLLEVGAGQAEAVADMLPRARIVSDLNGIKRVVVSERWRE